MSTDLKTSSIRCKQRGGARFAAILLVFCLSACGLGSNAQVVQSDVMLPARAAFYYPWYPETWQVNDAPVFYKPAFGHYRSGDQHVVDAHIRALGDANVEVGIASWWGENTHRENERVPLLLKRTQALKSPLKWSLYYEKEGSSNPSVTELEQDLHYLETYAQDAGYARVKGKPVLFVYNADDLNCSITERWAQATQGEWYVSLKVFPGYQDCALQPDTWHQYAPARASDQQPGYAYAISPGFWRADEAEARLERDLERWQQDVRAMVSSGEPWQLITTFNEWGEGTAVEASYEWGSAYLEVLAGDGFLEPRASLPTEGTVTAVAVGDIACDPDSRSFNGGRGTNDVCHMGAVAELAASLNPDALLVLGDIQYEDGTLAKYYQSYDLSWGALKSLTYPAVGNHEYLTPDAAGYFAYFGAAAGDPDKGYYSFNVGAWHVVVLNSNCVRVGGCHEASPQVQWLKRDLKANSTPCLLATWHHPRFSSGRHGNFPSTTTLWRTLQEADAELVLVGHDHHYERFAPQDAHGNADPAGIRQFVVGTGGKNRGEVEHVRPNSEVNSVDTYGVLRLTLHPDSYQWEFVPEPGGSFRDAGGDAC